MKKKHSTLVLHILVIVVIIVVLAISENMERIPISFRQEMPYSTSMGVLSTGIPYEFIGETDLLEYRRQYGFFWKEGLMVQQLLIHPPKLRN